MTAGAEHYEAAQQLLREAVTYDPVSDTSTVDTHRLLLAEVHASLARTACQAVCSSGLAWHDETAGRAWEKALGIAPRKTWGGES